MVTRRWVHMAALAGIVLVAGCSEDRDIVRPVARDRTYVGAAACQPCHADVVDVVSASGHPHKVTPVSGARPGDPLILPDNPPAGLAWSDIKYVIGGWGWKARFVKQDGYVVTGEGVQYNIPTPQYPTAEWVNYKAGETLKYDYACFRCHTTGPDQATDTFLEPGVQCEACHGPGSAHVASRRAEDIVTAPHSDACGQCHYRDAAKSRIIAKGGFIDHHEQFEELHDAGHASLDCTDCHDYHKGTRRGQVGGIVKTCEQCHTGVHSNHPDVQGAPTCVDCHMPYVGKSARAGNRYVADIRTHIFRLHDGPEDQSTMYETEGSSTYVKRGYGVTLDYACYQCHKDAGGVGGSASPLALDRAHAVAEGIHLQAPSGEATYIGAAACSGCHPAETAVVASSGHPYKVTEVHGEKPGAPLLLPDMPPLGLAWADIKYVIGGWGWKARFVKQDGYVLTGEGVQYNIPTEQYPETQWVDYNVGQTIKYDYACFRCHTTGPDQATDTFAQGGVQCEACHGPGSIHAVTQRADDILSDRSAEACGTCHYRDASRSRIPAKGGFIEHHEQYEEMMDAGHNGLECTTCHDYHAGVRRGQDGIVAACETCHPSVTLDHPTPEGLSPTCIDCHMPRATRSARNGNRYQGDVRTHIFALHSGAEDQTQMFQTDAAGTSVKPDYGVTLDFACYGCHKDPDGVGGWASTRTLAELAERARGIHGSGLAAR